MASPFTLLTDSAASPKLAKRPEGVTIHAAGLYLLPGDGSGEEVCGARSIACSAGCLGTTTGHAAIGTDVDAMGRIRQHNSVTLARLARTLQLLQDPEGTVEALTADIAKVARYAAATRKRIRRRALAAVRLNCTSDLDWHSILGSDGTTLLERFPDVHFYDYTKHADRMHAWLDGKLAPNYHLTYSRSETLRNNLAIPGILERGGNVAVVFSTPKGEPLPAKWNGHRVIDGRTHDFRFLDPQGVIVGLSALGSVMTADSRGMVIRV